jgi:hypothetical protein
MASEVKALLTQLATDIQLAINAYDPKDISSSTKIQAALKKMHKLIQPPEIALVEQGFHVRSAHLAHPSCSISRCRSILT